MSYIENFPGGFKPSVNSPLDGRDIIDDIASPTEYWLATTYVGQVFFDKASGQHYKIDTTDGTLGGLTYSPFSSGMVGVTELEFGILTAPEGTDSVEIESTSYTVESDGVYRLTVYGELTGSFGYYLLTALVNDAVVEEQYSSVSNYLTRSIKPMALTAGDVVKFKIFYHARAEQEVTTGLAINNAVFLPYNANVTFTSGTSKPVYYFSGGAASSTTITQSSVTKIVAGCVDPKTANIELIFTNLGMHKVTSVADQLTTSNLVNNKVTFAIVGAVPALKTSDRVYVLLPDRKTLRIVDSSASNIWNAGTPYSFTIYNMVHAKSFNILVTSEGLKALPFSSSVQSPVVTDLVLPPLVGTPKAILSTERLEQIVVVNTSGIFYRYNLDTQEVTPTDFMIPSNWFDEYSAGKEYSNTMYMATSSSVRVIKPGSKTEKTSKVLTGGLEKLAGAYYKPSTNNDYSIALERDPLPTDDISSSLPISKGKVWYNALTGKKFICLSDSPGNAVWDPLVSASDLTGGRRLTFGAIRLKGVDPSPWIADTIYKKDGTDYSFNYSSSFDPIDTLTSGECGFRLKAGRTYELSMDIVVIEATMSGKFTFLWWDKTNGVRLPGSLGGTGRPGVESLCGGSGRTWITPTTDIDVVLWIHHVSGTIGIGSNQYFSESHIFCKELPQATYNNASYTMVNGEVNTLTATLEPVVSSPDGNLTVLASDAVVLVAQTVVTIPVKGLASRPLASGYDRINASTADVYSSALKTLHELTLMREGKTYTLKIDYTGTNVLAFITQS